MWKIVGSSPCTTHFYSSVILLLFFCQHKTPVQASRKCTSMHRHIDLGINFWNGIHKRSTVPLKQFWVHLPFMIMSFPELCGSASIEVSIHRTHLRDGLFQQYSMIQKFSIYKYNYLTVKIMTFPTKLQLIYCDIASIDLNFL